MSKEVVNWKSKMAESAKEVARHERPTVSTISFKSGVMTYMGEPVKDNKLECIITASIQEQVFYSEAFDPDKITPPACFALAPLGESMAPHEAVGDEAFADTCIECPNFAWGSGRGKGKACSTRRRLSAVPANIEAADISKAEMAMMNIPVMSVRNWSNYVNKINGAFERPPWGVITLVTVVPDAKSQFRVTFDLVKLLDEDAILGALSHRVEADQQALMTPYDMTPPAPEEEQESTKGKKKY